MTKIVIAILLAAAPAIGIAQEQSKKQVTQQDIYDTFVNCSAYHIAHTKLEGLDGAAAAPDLASAETFMKAAFAVAGEKSQKEATDKLIATARALIVETKSGDVKAKQDFAGLGKVCSDLKGVAQGVIEEAKAKKLTNAT